MWINRRNDYMTSQQVCDWLLRLTGSSITVEELHRTYRPGAIYQNGSIWYQRLC